MNQELEEGRYYKNANQITQIIVAFVIFMCFFAMTPVGFTLYSKYALPVGLALLIIVFLISGNVVHMNKGDFFYIILFVYASINRRGDWKYLPSCYDSIMDTNYGSMQADKFINTLYY